MQGRVASLARTQTGSRYLQKDLNKTSCDVVNFLITDIGREMSKIMIDRYGNYFCQRLLSSCTAQQRLTILELIGPDFIKICCDSRGTHTI